MDFYERQRGRRSCGCGSGRAARARDAPAQLAEAGWSRRSGADGAGKRPDEPGVRGDHDVLAADSFIKSHPKWKFVFVNHVTTNPFFVPTQYGAAGRLRAARLHATSGPARQNADVGEMVNAFNAAISAKADGHRDRASSTRTRSRRRSSSALGKGIPVVVVQRRRRPRRPERAPGLHRPGPLRVRVRDGPADRRRSCRRATSRCSSPRPGALNIQPRIDGAHGRDQAVRQADQREGVATDADLTRSCR